ncbi:hypothetical protein P8452_26755 [Trifolium repens]|nr:hypothetical protein P8452_26755 [Trifolium repens]
MMLQCWCGGAIGAGRREEVLPHDRCKQMQRRDRERWCTEGVSGASRERWVRETLARQWAVQGRSQSATAALAQTVTGGGVQVS